MDFLIVRKKKKMHYKICTCTCVFILVYMTTCIFTYISKYSLQMGGSWLGPGWVSFTDSIDNDILAQIEDYTVLL